MQLQEWHALFAVFRFCCHWGCHSRANQAWRACKQSVAGPGLGTVILNYKFKSSSVRERALYLNEQLQLPENERVLSIKELDEGQVMHKPGKL